MPFLDRRGQGIMVWENSYIVDPLYGKWRLDELAIELAQTPEVQRLREVRLSNVNSLFMPGCANVSRFEHSIGVAILSSIAARKLRLDNSDTRNLIAAALLHDVGTPPFGHTVEFVLRKKFGFDHEEKSCEVIRGEYSKGPGVNLQFPFCGREPSAFNVLAKYQKEGVSVQEISLAIKGEGELGKLINGKVDLDNIDSVPRMAHHMGVNGENLPNWKNLQPWKIASGFRKRLGKLSFDFQTVPLVEDLLKVRRALYSKLLKNKADCSAKAMLTRATEIAIEIGALAEDVWALTDSELLSDLCNTPQVKTLAKRLRVGDLYEALGSHLCETKEATHIEQVLETRKYDIEEELMQKLKERRDLGKRVLVDIIIDMVPASGERSMDNLPFLPKELKYEDCLEELARARIGKTKTEWLLGVYTSRKKLEPRHFQTCRDYLSSIFEIDMRPAWPMPMSMMENVG